MGRLLNRNPGFQGLKHWGERDVQPAIETQRHVSHERPAKTGKECNASSRIHEFSDTKVQPAGEKMVRMDHEFRYYFRDTN